MSNANSSGDQLARDSASLRHVIEFYAIKPKQEIPLTEPQVVLEGSSYKAPAKCEMCDQHLLTAAERIKHIEETKHCACTACGAYVPPGRVEDHIYGAHGDGYLNDHMVAWEQSTTLKAAMPWVQAAHRKEAPMLYPSATDTGNDKKD